MSSIIISNEKELQTFLLDMAANVTDQQLFNKLTHAAEFYGGMSSEFLGESMLALEYVVNNKATPEKIKKPCAQVLHQVKVAMKI